MAKKVNLLDVRPDYLFCIVRHLIASEQWPSSEFLKGSLLYAFRFTNFTCYKVLPGSSPSLLSDSLVTLALAAALVPGSSPPVPVPLLPDRCPWTAATPLGGELSWLGGALAPVFCRDWGSVSPRCRESCCLAVQQGSGQPPALENERTLPTTGIKCRFDQHPVFQE